LDIDDSNLRSPETQKEALQKGRAALGPYLNLAID
jgi:hypothetical protein